MITIHRTTKSKQFPLEEGISTWLDCLPHRSRGKQELTLASLTTVFTIGRTQLCFQWLKAHLLTSAKIKPPSYSIMTQTHKSWVSLHCHWNFSFVLGVIRKDSLMAGWKPALVWFCTAKRGLPPPSPIRSSTICRPEVPEKGFHPLLKWKCPTPTPMHTKSPCKLSDIYILIYLSLRC